MRLWTIHPSYLDAKGLVALWREALLAQKVLMGNTIGYKHHPQLSRFRATPNPMGAIATYLRGVAAEADQRGYKFQSSKIVNRRYTSVIESTTGQLKFELMHLRRKLKQRDQAKYRELSGIKVIRLHPLFEQVDGPIEDWEIV